MAYLVAQMRKKAGTIYMQPITVTHSTITSPNPFGDTSENSYYTDFALAGTFSPQYVYYLRFQIHKIPQYFYSGSKTKAEVSMYEADADNLNLQVLLKNNDENDEERIPPEIIGTCSVPRALSTESQGYSSFSFVFTPSKTYDRIGFRINRVSFDAINKNAPRDWLIDETTDVTVSRWRSADDSTGISITTTGPRIIVQSSYTKTDGETTIDGDICTLTNLISSDFSTGWSKIGYQSRPGSLIVVNGQPIRVGRSGIYEINNGTMIKSFMIASPGGSQDTSKIDAFLLDYAYTG